MSAVAYGDRASEPARAERTMKENAEATSSPAPVPSAPHAKAQPAPAPLPRDAMPTKPRLSVLIVSHNCVGPLVACLESLQAERNALPLDVIVVDNASRDGSVAALTRRFPWVRLVANRQNVGFAQAANQALTLARGEYLLLLNPDTVVAPGSLTAVVDKLERHPDVGMLGCKLVRPDGSFDHACKRGFPTIASSFYYLIGLSRLLPTSPRFARYTAGHLGLDATGHVDAVSGAFMLVRREAVANVGEMDERYWLYGEDLDWCHRFWERGWKILYWPDVEVTHIKGASAGNHRSWKLNLEFHRSIWLFYAKHHRTGRPAIVSGLVWLGIWTRFAMTTLHNSLRAVSTSLARRPTGPPDDLGGAEQRSHAPGRSGAGAA